MVEQWVSEWPETGGWRRKGWSQRSIVYGLQALKLVMDYGADVGVITRSPVEGVRPPRKTGDDHRTFRVWTVHELGCFIEAADRDDLAAAWRLTACGLRRSEVLGSDWDAVDFDGGTVRVE